MDTATQNGPSTAETPTKAREAAGQAKDTMQGAAGQAQEKVQGAAQGAAEQAKEQAGRVGTQAKGRVREQLDQRSTDFGKRAGDAASDLRSVGDELRNQGKDAPAKLATQVADRVDQAGTYLQDADADRVLNDVEDFGRQRPWAVVAGGLALGFAASRVLKSSSSQRYQRSAQRSPGTGAQPLAQTGPGRGMSGQPGFRPAPTATPRPTASPLDDVAADAARSAADAPVPPVTPAGSRTDPATHFNREREEGLGGHGLS